MGDSAACVQLEVNNSIIHALGFQHVIFPFLWQEVQQKLQTSDYRLQTNVRCEYSNFCLIWKKRRCGNDSGRGGDSSGLGDGDGEFHGCGLAAISTAFIVLLRIR